MFWFLTKRVLNAVAKHYDYDYSYALAMHDASPKAFRKFMAVAKLASHREAASVEAIYAAKLVGTLLEDCGPCTQLVVNMAREKGMSDAQLAAVLGSQVAAMSPDTALGFRFAKAIASRMSDEDAAREAVRARWGEKGVIDLTFAVQISRMFPMIKAGLGYATACRRVQVGTSPIEVVRQAA